MVHVPIIEDKIAPILVIAFNRADSTRKVIDALIASGIREVYFAVDGPRVGIEADTFKVSEVKNLINEYEDEIRFKKYFQEDNLGCRLAVTYAINWFFSQVDGGIILEDDCVPSKDFLIFSSRMLERYHDNDLVMHVGGSSYLRSNLNYAYNHYYSSFHEVWGWATWARAWKHFQLNPGSTSSQEDYLILEYFKSKKVAKWFQGHLIQARGKAPSVWSTQWSLSIIRNRGIAVNPINNLVKNIGFGEDSTHGSSESFSLYDEFPVTSLSLLPDPPTVEINYTLDKLRFKIIRKTDPSLFLVNRFKKWVRSIFINFLPQKIATLIRRCKSLCGL